MASSHFRPTLLVGVGGTGCEIVERVYTQALGTEIGRTGKIVVMGFDTDDNDMRRLNAIERVNRIRFSSPETVGEMTRKYRELIAPWFFDPPDALPEGIKKMTLFDGAAQIRMFTHLGLFTQLTSGTIPQRIGNALASLGRYDNADSYDGVVNVMMVGSLAGATGSGSFIQLALLIQREARSRGVQADVRGLFLMPDVYVYGASLPVTQIPNVLSNGYASLRELNAVNSLASGETDAANLQYEYAPGHLVGQGDFPFYSVTLMDFETSGGGSLGQSVDSYKSMAKRAVYQQIFSPIGGRVRSIETNDARAKFAAAAQGADNKFSAIGVGAVVFPKEAVADYLTLDFAAEALTGDWVRLDRQFQDRVRRYREQREQGNVLEKPPQQGPAYIEDLDNLATVEKNAFFAEIHDNLHPRVEVDGRREVRAAYRTYLDAILAQVIEGFWATDRLSEARDRRNIDESQLRNKGTLSTTVRDLERNLDNDLQDIESLVRSRPTDVFTNILTNADNRAEAAWQDYHIQKYIIKDGPHLVQIRYFIYALHRLIEERRAALDPDDLRARLFRQANQFDPDRGRDPAERGTSMIIEQATDAAMQGTVSALFGDRSKAFAAHYATYHNTSRRFLRAYTEEAISMRFYNDLERELEQFEKVLGGLVVEVEGIVESLNQTAEREIHRHDGNSAQDGSLFIYANAACKRAMREEMRDKSSGSRQDRRVNAEIADMIYARYREDRRGQPPDTFDGMRDRFRETVVDGFARRVVTEELSSVYALDIVEALRREAALMGRDMPSRLREVVQIVGRQSEPLVKLQDDRNNGQRITYWAVHPDIREAIGDPKLFEDLFTVNQGEAPVVLAEFSKAELLCMSSRVNLELRHLSKLHPGASVEVGQPVGRYAEAYEKIVETLLDADREGRPPTEFTPHIHRDWHRHGALPEIHKSKGEQQSDRIYRAFLFSLASGILSSTTEYGARVTEFNTVGKLRTGGIRKTVVQDDAYYPVLLAFEKRSELLQPAETCWAELSPERRDASGEVAQTVREVVLTANLIDPDFVSRMLEVSRERRDAEDRDPRMRGLVRAWATLVRDLVDQHEGAMALAGRSHLTEEIIGDALRAAFDAMRAHMRPETMADIETLAALGVSDFRESALG